MKKKLIMFMSMILSLICFVSCNNEKKTTFKLDVVDNFNLLVNKSEIKNEYAEGTEIEVILAFRSGPSVGLILNGKNLYLDHYEGAYSAYKFTIDKDSKIITTMNGNTGIDCGGNHKWNQGEVVQVPGGGEDVIYTCQNCFTTTTNINDNDDSDPINRFKDSLEIGNLADRVVEVTSTNNHFEFEIGWMYYLYLFVKDELITNDDFCKQVDVSFSNDNSNVLYQNYNGYANYLLYSFYPLKKSNSNQLEINYKDFNYKFTYDIVDFDFSKHHATKPSSERINDNQEFKKLIDSISYYQFKEPYKGLDSYSSSNNFYSHRMTYYFKKDETDQFIYDTSYLEKLTDSIYYPSYFPMVNDNPIALRQMEMEFDDESKIKEGSSSSLMTRFSLYYSVIDPDCTMPKNNLSMVTYDAIPINYLSDKQINYNYSYHTLNSGYYFLSKLYPDQFYSYQVNGLDIKIILLYDSEILAFFDDGTYAYTISFHYTDFN